MSSPVVNILDYDGRGHAQEAQEANRTFLAGGIDTSLPSYHNPALLSLKFGLVGRLLQVPENLIEAGIGISHLMEP